MGKKAAIILAGCGYREGTEIHEAVLSYLALAEASIDYDSYSIKEQMSASAPIARDQIRLISELKESDYDILWMPGGFGVAKHLSTFAKEQIHCSVHPEVQRVIVEFYEAQKPIVAICFAPVVVAKALEGKGIQMTLGRHKKDLEILEKLGMKPISCKVDEFCFDQKHKVITTPGYMEPPSIQGIYQALIKVTKVL